MTEISEQTRADREHARSAAKPWASELIIATNGAAWVTTFLTLEEARESAIWNQARHNAGQARLSSVTVHHYNTATREWDLHESFPLDDPRSPRP